MLFHACPLLHQWSHDHEQAFTTFMQYKTRVPVCGAIMLNDTWEKVCILPFGWIFAYRDARSKVRSGERLEIIFRMGLSERQNQRGRTAS